MLIVLPLHHCVKPNYAHARERIPVDLLILSLTSLLVRSPPCHSCLFVRPKQPTPDYETYTTAHLFEQK